MIFLVPDPRRRSEYLAVFFEFLVKSGILYGDVYATTDRFEGVAVWFGETGAIQGFIPAIRSGILRVARVWKKDSFTRLRAMASELDRRHASLLDEPHFYLNLIGVDPQCRKRGFGSHLLSSMLERADDEKKPCYLETFSGRDVAFYEKFGFGVAAEFDIDGLRVWAMARPKEGAG
jgi:ribosomal protein S18 acetylase RimI-like enzyme